MMRTGKQFKSVRTADLSTPTATPRFITYKPQGTVQTTPTTSFILCEQYGRVVGRDNCVSFEGMKLQIPSDRHRCHYIKATVKVHRYLDDTLTVFHGPRELARYDSIGIQINERVKAIA